MLGCIQLALDVAGFVPGFGAVPDLLNAGISALRGDFMGAGLCVLAAVPIIGDSTKAAVMVKKGLKSAKAVSKVGNLTKITDKVRRSELLTKEAANFVRVDVSKQQLIKSGLSEADADFFMKKVRGYRRKEIVKIYSSFILNPIPQTASIQSLLLIFRNFFLKLLMCIFNELSVQSGVSSLIRSNNNDFVIT